MTKPWAAEFAVSIELAQSLIQEQFPDLKINNISLLGEGWDNMAYLINDDLVFRFPRREVAVRLLKNEINILEEIGNHIDCPIPRPIHIGKSSERFLNPFMSYKYLAGDAISDLDLDDNDRTSIARPLASFLKQLHDMPKAVINKIDIQPDDTKKIDLDFRAPPLLEHLEHLADNKHVDGIAAYEKIIEAAYDSKLKSELAIVHGDLYSRHILVNSNNEMTAVIDWGDAVYGHIAIDLGVIYSLFPPKGRQIFIDHYGQKDDSVWKHARFRALSHTVSLYNYALDVSNQSLIRESIRAMSYIQEP